MLPVAGSSSPPPFHRGIARLAAMLPHAQTTIHRGGRPPALPVLLVAFGSFAVQVSGAGRLGDVV